MKFRIIFAIATFIMLGTMSCMKRDELTRKKDKLEKYNKKLKELKVDQQELREDIAELEKEIAVLDPEFARANRTAKLVTSMPVKQATFQHFVEISSSVASKKNVQISAENTGTIKSILVKEGDYVNAGQTMITMDTELLQRSLEQLQTQYNMANITYEKQKNLWDKNIGTEIQYLQAKTNKETLEDQIKNVKSQISKSIVTAPFAGTVELVSVRIGELASPGTPLARIVSLSELSVEGDVSESYLGAFKRNDPVIIEFPALGKKIETKLSAVGQVIDANNRTFRVEAKLPEIDFMVKPNLVAIMKLKDFEAEQASIVPTNLIQKDNNGEFVYTVEEVDGGMVAKKIHIERGRTYRNETMIVSGLNGTETIIDEGFRDVSSGQKIKIVKNVL